ncbi:LysR family transcriptional regulator [Kaustia mangrovi]|uniref:LysR family transcriptional regulator n=1 Tax=Kaustia mangrovi TaxID=2593653 RepID=A0A7S8HB36_9HYPH|nr:LysR family transcriptional regulator [Kaustia mangrovi]QPC41743.1 LysR family transcriptional regulator [Kaustia mangrovi]
MRPTDISDLMAFVAVAKRRSFRKAAVDLGITPSAVSHRIRALEDRLGVRVLNRTTRSVAPTSAGQRLLKQLRPAFESLEGALDAVNDFRDQPAGTLRLNAPHLAVDVILAPVMKPFLEAFPDIHLEISANDSLVDIVAEGYDAGIRFGERLQQDMIAMKLGPQQRDAIVASPEYFRKNPKPKMPEDLAGHACIRYRFPGGELYAWEFAKGEKEIEIDVQGPLTLDSQRTSLRAAAEGLGIANVLESLARPLLEEGRVVRALEDWCPTYPGLFLYYPSRRRMPSPLRAFVDFTRSLDDMQRLPAGGV